MVINLLKKLFICLIIVIIYWIFIQKKINEIVIRNELNKITQTKINIISYNIQKLPWIIKNFDPIIGLLNKFDIILLQECFDEMSQNLEDVFPKYNIYRGKLKNINLMNSGLVIMSKFPFVEDKCFFYIYKNSNKYSNDSLGEKGFISVDLIINNQIITFISTHYQCSNYSRHDENALLQFDELCKYLRKIKNKFIVGGDFNIDVIDLQKNKSKIMKKLKLKHYYPKNNTIYVDFNTSDSVAYPKLNYVGLKYDYFISNFVIEKKNNSINCVKTIPDANSSIWKKNLSNDNFYSDHLPVVLVVDF